MIKNSIKYNIQNGSKVCGHCLKSMSLEFFNKSITLSSKLFGVN